MRKVFSQPEKKRVYFPLISEEMMKIGVQSIGIVGLLAFFMGAVVALQTASNIESGWIPKWTVGYTTKQTMIYEFSSTIVALVLAGKVGSNIASEIGTMRISEQIDALDIMGINSASYLILPKIVAAIFILPFLVLLAMFIGIGAGALIAVLTNIVSLTDFIYGIQ
ncbi:MAG: MlaE family ABC transporter permease, partial [Bacteroidota bacterium]